MYVAGSLTESENQEIHALSIKHPEILIEILKIEKTIVKLTASASPFDATKVLPSIKEKLNLDNETSTINLNSKKSKWMSYSGWAASILLASGLTFSIIQNNQLNKKYNTVKTEQKLLEQQISNANSSLADAKKLNTVLRDKDIIAVPLSGQSNFTETYAKVYWQKKTKQVYIDAQGLPEPPKGMVYQVWSLKLNPLTPTSLGLLDDFIADDNKVFALNNSDNSEAFGITLEPSGGSKTPTMSQLYTLGVIKS
jgi:anti-sigma-K factor RskA